MVYSQDADSKNALLNSLYRISQMQPQQGVEVEHLTQRERKRKLYETFLFRNSK